MKFRKKPEGIEAIQWNKHGDHFAVFPATKEQAAGLVPGLLWEHAGWIGSLRWGRIVKPGTWIFKDENGEIALCEQKLFEELYEPIPE